VNKKHNKEGEYEVSPSRRKFVKSAAGGAVVLAGLASCKKSEQLKIEIPKVETATFSQLKESGTYDICIIGSGVAGTVLGSLLADAGLKVLVVESGFDLRGTKFDSAVFGLDQYESTGSVNYPASSSRLRAIGGTANMWSGRCSRLHPNDFAKNAYTPIDNPWPITYSEIDKYYDRAEKTLKVKGGALSQYHAPRSFQLPKAPGGDISDLKNAAKAVGITIDESPTSYRADGEPMRVSSDLILEYAKKQTAMLVDGVTITNFNIDQEGRIISAVARSLDKQVHNISAKAFVVACGGMESSRLLLLAKSEQFPNGVGNNHDQVGRHFMVHPNILYSADIAGSGRFNRPKGELGRCHQFYDSFKKDGYGSPLLVFQYKPKKKSFAEKVNRYISGTYPVSLSIGATIELEPVEDNRITLSKNIKDSFGNPGANVHISYTKSDNETFKKVRNLIKEIYGQFNATNIVQKDSTWSHHHLGGCRMGDSPKTSVVDKTLKVHDTKNLFVVSSATFVTSGGAHPTLAIVALAHRLADHLKSGLNSL
jgi:choline dehydrogenase-like flavoprotein